MKMFTRRGLILSGAALAASGISESAQAAVGSISFRIVSAGFVVGVAGGDGVLNFAGRHYGLSIGGISAGATIGAAEAHLYGSVLHIRDARDIEGVYSKVGVGGSVVHGSQEAELVNANGVVLRVRGREVGLMISFDLSGMSISLKR